MRENLNKCTKKELLDVLHGYKETNNELARKVKKLKKLLEAERQISNGLRKEKYNLFVQLETLRFKVKIDLMKSNLKLGSGNRGNIFRKSLRKPFRPTFRSVREKASRRENVPPQDSNSSDSSLMDLSDSEDDEEEGFLEGSIKMPKPISKNKKIDELETPMLRKPLTKKNLNATPSSKGSQPVACSSSPSAVLETSLQNVKPVASTSTAKTHPVSKTGGVQEEGQQIKTKMYVRLERITDIEYICQQNDVKLWKSPKGPVRVKARRSSSAQ